VPDLGFGTFDTNDPIASPSGEADKAEKFTLVKIVQSMNDRGPLRADERAAASRKRKQADRQ
jgi:hypothetical protein